MVISEPGPRISNTRPTAGIFGSSANRINPQTSRTLNGFPYRTDTFPANGRKPLNSPSEIRLGSWAVMAKAIPMQIKGMSINFALDDSTNSAALSRLRFPIRRRGKRCERRYVPEHSPHIGNKSRAHRGGGSHFATHDPGAKLFPFFRFHWPAFVFGPDT